MNLFLSIEIKLLDNFVRIHQQQQQQQQKQRLQSKMYLFFYVY
jgi:hypothetical protein